MTSPLACALLACALLHPAPFPARTALDEQRIEDLPFDVTAPGTYVLTGDLGPSGAPYGIRILTDDVVIDLGGKVLEGGPGSGAGILAEGERRDIVVRNGRVLHWGADGVALASATDVELRDVVLLDNGGHGAHLGARARLSACVSDFNHGGLGFVTGPGATIAGCTARANEYGGILAGAGSTLLECRAEESLYGPGLQVGPEGVLRDCQALANHSAGIRVGAGSLVADCSARANLAMGIEAGPDSIVRGCIARATVDGSGLWMGPGGWVEDCESTGNRRRGLDLHPGAIARGCTLRQNGLAGLRARTGCRLIGNTCESNGAAGIELIGSRVTVDGNVLGSNGVLDLSAPGRGHFVVRNTVAAERTSIGEGGFVAPFSAREDPGRGPWDNLQP